MVKLFCAIVGVAGSAFPVNIDESETVGDLKEVIWEKIKEKFIHDDKFRSVVASDLQLSLAKKGAGWLPSAELRAIRKGDDVPGFERVSLVDTEDEAYSTYSIRDVLETNGMPPPQTRQIHVLVVVSDGSNVANDSPLPSAITHSENRRKRWRELNEILDKNKKAKTNGVDGSSTGYSYVRWSDVKSVLDYERYKQERKPIPDHAFDFLIKYLKYAAKAMNGYTDASREAKRYHFIAPVLIMLCSLFVDVKLEVEESVDGNEVHANGNFEFVLTRGKTKICIVEAKKNDFDQGKAQALIGCEAVADREGLFVVYGIVTDFMKWQIYRCGENSILLDSSTLSAKSEELDTGSMRDVCEMIYGALSDHEEECKKEQLCIE